MADADRPDRPGRRDQARLWAAGSAALLAVPVCAVAGWALLVGEPSRGRGAIAVVLSIIVLLTWAHDGLLRAVTLSRRPGRFAFVVDAQEVPIVASWRRRLLRLDGPERWLHLQELDGRSLGWVQVSPRRWAVLRDQPVVAVWGAPGQESHLVLSGPFPTSALRGTVCHDLQDRS